MTYQLPPVKGEGLTSSQSQALNRVTRVWAITDPAQDAATTQETVNAYSGVAITTTATGNSQEIALPTNGATSFFVSLTPDSTNIVVVNNISIQIGSVVFFRLDGQNWIGEPFINSLIGSLSSCWVSGCEKTINANNAAKFDIAPGVVDVADYTDLENPRIKRINFAGSVGEDPLNLGSQLITAVGIDINGEVVKSNTPFFYEAARDVAVIGSVGHPDLTTITAFNDFTTVLNSRLAASVYDLYVAIGTMNISGNVISPNGANMKLDISGGAVSFGGVSSQSNSKNPNVIEALPVTGFTFVYVWRNPAGGFFNTFTDTIIANVYDDGVTSTAAGPNGAVAGNRWQIQRVYIERSSGTFAIHFGQDRYNSLAEAEGAIFSEAFDKSDDLTGFLLRCYLVVRGGNTSTLKDSTRAKFIPAGKFGESAASGATSSTTTLGAAYQNSMQPQIGVTDSLGELQLKNDRALDTEKILSILNIANQETFAVQADGTISLSGSIGFNGSAPTSKPTVTGSLTDGTALSSLISALTAMGLVDVNTTP